MTTLTPHNHNEAAWSGGRLVSTTGLPLPLRATEIDARAGAGLARTRVVQTFENSYGEPLAVTYRLPLPVDGAVSGFAFRIGDQRIVGKIDRRDAAREQFETALVEGRTAALLEEDRPNLFTQEIGNIPAGATVIAEIDVDHPLAWIEGGWEWRMPTTVGPRYLGAEGRVVDAGKVSVDVVDGPLPKQLALQLTIDDEQSGPPTSPSHPLVSADGTTVALGEGAALDRDVVIRWPVARESIGTSLRTEGHDQEQYGLLTVLPPTVIQDPLPRDLIVLIDTSGSMGGAPLQQAKHVVKALIATMTERDQLQLIEFSTRPRAFREHPVRMDASGRSGATAWIDSLRSGGATEMYEAIRGALTPLRAESQRQIVLVSDGLIGFESEIVAEVLHRLPNGSRVHTIGVGSSVNRALTEGAARAGRGVEAIVAIGEDPSPAARKIVAATEAPTVVDLELSGSALLGVASSRLPDLFGGQPARISVQLSTEGGELSVRGRTATGTWSQTLDVAPISAAATGPQADPLALRYGRESVADLEMRVAGGQSALDQQIEAIGLQFRIATRLTSWIAVSDEATVDPQQPTRAVRIPHALPHGMSVAGLGLRGAPLGAMPASAPMDRRKRTAPRNKSRLLGRIDLPDSAISKPITRGKRGGPAQDSKAPDFEAVDFDAPLRESPRAPDLFGRVVLDRDGTVVIEIESDGRKWRQPKSVSLRFGPKEIRARLIKKDSTRNGPTELGMTIRLALELGLSAADLSADRATHVVLNGGEVIVELHPES